MLPVDNLYVLDVPGNAHTLKILTYFNENIQKYNGLAKRKIRVYRLTKPMIKQDDIVKKFESKGITVLPSFEVFQPTHAILSNAEEIIAFCEILFKAILARGQKKQQQPPQQAGPMLLNGDNPYADFYKNEIVGKDSDEDMGANMATHMSDRYRTALQGRNPKSRTAPDNQDMDEMGDTNPTRRGGGGAPPIPEEPPGMDATAEDNVMSSVNKICGDDADGQIEKAFFANLQETPM
jgi:hypothetical protein